MFAKRELSVADKSGNDAVGRVAVNLIVARRKYTSAARRQARSIARNDVRVKSKRRGGTRRDAGRIARNHTAVNIHFGTKRSESGRIVDRARISDRRLCVAAQIHAGRVICKDGIADCQIQCSARNKSIDAVTCIASDTHSVNRHLRRSRSRFD